MSPRQGVVDDQRVAAKLSQVFALPDSFVVVPVVKKISGRRSNQALRLVVAAAAGRSRVHRLIGGFVVLPIVFRRVVSTLQLFLRRGSKTSDLSLKIFQHSPDRLKTYNLSTLASAILEILSF